MNVVFIDASFWIAYRGKDDKRRNEAAHLIANFHRENAHLVTTLPVLCEIHAFFTRNTNKREIILQDLWKNRLVRVEVISISDQTNAVEILRSNRDKTYSLCDALSFAVMRRLGIRRVASFDRHFKQFGEFEIAS